MFSITSPMARRRSDLSLHLQNRNRLSLRKLRKARLRKRQTTIPRHRLRRRLQLPDRDSSLVVAC